MARIAEMMLLRGQGIVSSRVTGALPALARRRASVCVRSAAAVETSTKVRYAKRADKKDLFYYTAPPENDAEYTNLEPEDVDVELKDLRTNNEMQWQRNGFELVQFPAAQQVCWDDKEQVRHHCAHCSGSATCCLLHMLDLFHTLSLHHEIC